MHDYGYFFMNISYQIDIRIKSIPFHPMNEQYHKHYIEYINYAYSNISMTWILEFLFPEPFSNHKAIQLLNNASFHSIFPADCLIPDTFHPKEKWLYLKNIKDDQLHQKFIEKMSQQYPSASIFYLWNSSLSFSFFQKISQSNWRIWSLYLHNCNIGNTLIKKLSMLNLSNLHDLSLALDSFNNKVLTQLMKLSLTNDFRLHINHTMITTDCLQALKKMNNGRFLTIRISKQHRFIYTSIIRQFGLLRTKHVQGEPSLIIDIKSLANQDHFAYTGYAAKLQFEQRVITKVKIIDDEDEVPNWQNTMMVPKVIMEKHLNWIEYHLI